MAKESLHMVNGKLIRIPRKWNDVHITAGYHKQEWGEHATKNHKLLGRHGDILVEYVEDSEHIGGPEFKLTWDNGVSVTVLCADVVKQYLEASNRTLTNDE